MTSPAQCGTTQMSAQCLLFMASKAGIQGAFWIPAKACPRRLQAGSTRE